MKNGKYIRAGDSHASPAEIIPNIGHRFLPESSLRKALSLVDPRSEGFRPFAWMLILWFIMVIPAMFIRGAHYEEGTTVGLARGAFESGHWLTPFRYGVRFVERPVLISWVLGAVGMLTGWIPLWLARVPTVVAFLTGDWLIYRLVRRYAGPRAAMFGALSFMVSPMMLQKTVTAEVDCVLSVALFAAYVLWWTGGGDRATGPTIPRWGFITLLLCAAGYIKGPQPLGYFFVGVGLYLAVRRRWRQFSILLASGLLTAIAIGAWYFLVYRGPADIHHWMNQSRLITTESVGTYLFRAGRFIVVLSLELLPALLLAGPLVLDLIGGRFVGQGRETVIALLMYAGGSTLALTFWPGANGRYAMPSVLAIAAVAGIGFEHLLARRARIVQAAKFVAASLAIYAIVVSAVLMPLIPGIFQHNLHSADLMKAAMAQEPGALYIAPQALNCNELVYIRRPIRVVSLDRIVHSKLPFFALVTSGQNRRLKAGSLPLALDLPIGKPPDARHLIEVK